jgi:hypothetical protein
MEPSQAEVDQPRIPQEVVVSPVLKYEHVCWPSDLLLWTLMSRRAGTRGNYPYHSQGRLASLRGCEVLLVVVQASAGYCIL